MSKERFLFILQAQRFDNPADREERKREIKEAAIANVFNTFVENCKACYTVGEAVCIDEMLVPFRGNVHSKCTCQKNQQNISSKFNVCQMPKLITFSMDIYTQAKTVMVKALLTIK